MYVNSKYVRTYVGCIYIMENYQIVIRLWFNLKMWKIHSAKWNFWATLVPVIHCIAGIAYHHIASNGIRKVSVRKNERETKWRPKTTLNSSNPIYLPIENINRIFFGTRTHPPAPIPHKHFSVGMKIKVSVLFDQNSMEIESIEEEVLCVSCFILQLSWVNCNSWEQSICCVKSPKYPFYPG